MEFVDFYKTNDEVNEPFTREFYGLLTFYVLAFSNRWQEVLL